MAHSTAAGPESSKKVAGEAGAVSRAIVVGYDGSDQAKAALEIAIDLARLRGIRPDRRRLRSAATAGLVRLHVQGTRSRSG